METSKIQTLFDACNDVFSEQSATSQQSQRVTDILDNIQAADVGVNEFIVLGSEITYIHIHECKKFTIGIFCIPAGKSIPLHDHPEMTVLSKLLYGSVHVKSYDWLTKKSGPPTCGVSVLVNDDVLNAPREPLVLFPRSGGNIHSFTAVTPCAILDVINPPYSEKDGRHCTYFTASPIPTLPGYAMLEERDMPDDLVMNLRPYIGPSLKIGKKKSR